MKSVAIPPIGTGKLGFDPHFVAKVMREELFQFSRRNPQSSLRDVRCVVYQKEDVVFHVSSCLLRDQSALTSNRRRDCALYRAMLVDAFPGTFYIQNIHNIRAF